MALEPRAAILPQVAGDAARAAQAIVLRVESLGIQIHPRRAPLAWLRQDGEVAADPALSPPAPLEADEDEEPSGADQEDEPDAGPDTDQQALPPEQNGLMSGRTGHAAPPDLRPPLRGDAGPGNRPGS
jgi:hypothetical protein